MNLINIKNKIKNCLLPISHSIKEKIWRVKWFRLRQNSGSFVGLISCVDGKLWHGGMCDRLKGIISTYSFCKVNNIPFRIHYTYPFNLEKYLEPNKYDWVLKEGELSENIFNTRVLYLIGEASINRFHLPKRTQIHVYANRDTIMKHNDTEWGMLYKELFKPSFLLQERLNQFDFKTYVALVFRFQNLIGDFQEYNFKPLDSYSQEILLNKCKSAVLDMSLRHPNHNILVTSDSVTFLKTIKNFDRVKIIPGEIVHMDSEGPQSHEERHLKSFIDFYMIANAEKVYSIGTSEMYPSEFPKYAAKINNVPFERILI